MIATELRKLIYAIAFFGGVCVCLAPPARPDLVVSVGAAPASVSVGELISFTVRITNQGTAAATQVHLVNTLGTSGAFFTVAASQGAFSQSNDVVDASLGSLGIGAGAVLQVAATPLAAGRLTNSATASAAEADANSANNTAGISAEVASVQFAAGPNLAAARYLHTATPLADGRIAFIGGESPTGTLASAEIYSPASGQFTNAGAMQFFRAWHTASPLPDGRVLVTGGFGYGRHSSAEALNPATGTFQVLGGLMAEARMRHVAGVLTNGNILIAAGYTGGGSSENYAPYDSFFTAGPALLHERVGPSVERMSDGRLLLLGGYPTSTPQGELRCEFYVPGPAAHFEEAGSLGVNRYNCTTVLLANGKVLITGGYLPDVNQTTAAAELFDPAIGTTRRLINMIWPRMFHTATRLTNGKVLLTGGGTAEAELFDPATETFRPTVRMSYPRSQHTASLLADGRVLIVGGDSGTDAVAPAEYYDPARVKTPPAITITDAAVAEGDAGTNGLTFNLQLSSPMGVPVSVAFTSFTGTANWEDFEASSGSIVFSPGETNGSITVQIRGDTTFEQDESFGVRLSLPTNAVIARSEALGTIVNDDPMPEISVLAAAWPETNLRTTNRLISVTLSRPSEAPVIVAFQTLGITAAAGVDFVATNGVLMFAGTTNLEVPIVVKGDLEMEPDETLTLEFSNPTNGIIAAAQGSASLLNDDGAPGFVHHFSITIPGPPAAARIPSSITVTALDAFDQPITNFGGSVLLMAGFSNLPPIHLDFEEGDFSVWSPLNGSSQPGPYEIKPFDTAGTGSPSLAFRISPNNGGDGIQTTKFIPGGVRQYFSVNIADVLESGWAIDSATTTRLVMDSQVNLLSNRTGLVYVGSPLRTNLFGSYDYLTYSLNRFLALTFDRPYFQSSALGIYADDLVISPAPLPGTRTGAFTNGVWSGPVTFRDAVTNVILFADDDERHRGNSAMFDIQQSLDLAVGLGFAPATPRVGNINVNLAVTNLGPRAATGVVVTNGLPAGLTFVSASSVTGTCTNMGTNALWQVGALSSGQVANATVVVRATDTNTFSPVAFVSVNEPDFKPANNTATTTFTPGLPSLGTLNMSATEQTGGGIMTFPVTLSGPFDHEVTVEFYTSWPPIAGTFDGDIIPTNGILVFPPGVTQQQVDIVVVDDVRYEGTEFFSFVLDHAQNAVVGNGTYSGLSWTATLYDNELPPTLAVNDCTVVEGDAGTTDAFFTVTLTGLTALTTTVNYATASGTALAGSDFVSTNGTLTFPPGTSSQNIVVRVTGNTVNESNEVCYVNLSSPVNATLADAQGAGTILNDDAVQGRLDHFVWANIASPQITNRAVPASLTAVDPFGSVLSNFTATVALSALASGGVTNLGLTPLLASNFVAGTWTGAVQFTNTGNQVVLRADDGLEHIGLGNAFNVLAKFPLLLVLPSAVTEGDGALVNQGRVWFPQPEGTNVWVALTSAATNALQVPEGVWIASGQTSAVFTITVLDDALLNGSRGVAVTAAASGYTGTNSTVVVHDNDFALLSVTLPASAPEKSSPLQGTVTVSAPPATNVVVTLTSSDTTELTVPASVTLPTGQTSAVFSASVVDDTLLDGAQTALVTAHVQNWQDGAAAVAVLDNETNQFTISLFPFNETPFAEGRGTVSNAFRLTVGGILISNLPVNLASSDTTELLVPATVIIPSGTNAVLFNSTAVDDAETDGTQPVMVTASLPGFAPGGLLVNVLDDDLHHFAFSTFLSVQTSGVPFNLTVTAKDVNNVTLTRYTNSPTFTATGSSSGLPVVPGGFSGSGILRGSFSGSVAVTAPVAQMVTLRTHDGLGHEGTSSPFELRYPAWAGTPQITQVQLLGADVLLSFPSVVGAQYFVEMATNLPPAWQSAGAGVIGTGATLTMTNTGAGAGGLRFFRLLVHPAP